ncbi:MAG: hypothetical protein R3C69_01945 [Geminicoccaceae bacterium]
MNPKHPSRPDQGLPLPPFPTAAEIQRHVARGRMLRAETTAAILRALGRSLLRAVRRPLAPAVRQPAAPQPH